VRLLLDTHALFWYIDGSPQLSATAHRLIQDAANLEADRVGQAIKQAPTE
jgi:PIN domain nuclease of toxin-antitoxin system